MCLLTFYPAGILPDVTTLANGAYVNDDGHGFAIVTGRRILVRRGLDAERMVTSFDHLRGKYPDGPALFHSRFGTHGTIGRHNCHPFRVGGDRRTVLAHNGILPKMVQPREGDTRSDTRIAAEDLLPRKPFGSLGSWRGRDRLAKWLGPGNKIVILTVDPHYRENSYIVNEDRGIWDSGVWYSNNDYREPERWEIRDWRAAPACPVCHAVDAVDPYVGFCMECGCCIDCSAPAEYCFCYVPEKSLA
jgi:Glutamine amidotransferases class-II